MRALVVCRQEKSSNQWPVWETHHDSEVCAACPTSCVAGISCTTAGSLPTSMLLTAAHLSDHVLPHWITSGRSRSHRTLPRHTGRRCGRTVVMRSRVSALTLGRTASTLPCPIRDKAHGLYFMTVQYRVNPNRTYPSLTSIPGISHVKSKPCKGAILV